MKNKLLIFLFCLVNAAAIAQVDNNDKLEIKQVNNAVKQAIKLKNVKHIDSLIALRNAEKSANCGYWQSGKAHALTEIHRKELKHYDKNDPVKSAKVKEILDTYEKAINECSDCALINKYLRFKFLDNVDECNDLYISDLTEMKKLGYKKMNNGFGLGLNYFKGIDSWIGGEFSLLQGYQPSFTVKEKDVSTGKKIKIIKDPANSFTVFSFAYNYNWQKKIHDFSFSLLSIKAPAVIDFTRIGFQKKDLYAKGNWFYRPELGTAIGPFSLNFAYNFMFSKAAREVSERGMFGIRYAPQVYKYKENKKNANRNYEED